MLTRIEKIQGHRLFLDYSWKNGLPDFARFNLIYGWNGSGKTTLSNIFRHLQELSPIEEGDVRFRFDKHVVNGADIHNSKLPQVRVFNRDTVDRNLFEAPDRQFPPVYYVGRHSADTQRKIHSLKKEQNKKLADQAKLAADAKSASKALDQFCIDAAGKIKNLLTKPGGGRYNNFDKTDFSDRTKRFLHLDEPSFCLLEQEKESCLQAKDSMPMREIPEINLSLREYFEQTEIVRKLLETTVVSSTIEELVENPPVANWVQSGIALHTGENSSEICHFCKNELNRARVEALESHFSGEFIKLQQKLNSEIRTLEAYKEKIGNLVLPEESLLYPHLVAEYGAAIKTWITTRLWVAIFLDSLIQALKAKEDAPFKKLDLQKQISTLPYSEEELGWLKKVLGVATDVARAAFAAAGINCIKNINAIIAKHNSYGRNFAQEVEKAREKLAIHEISASLEVFQTLSGTLHEAETALGQINESIAEIGGNIEELEKANRAHSPAADELNSEMQAYLGRGEIRFESRDDGYIILRDGKPALHLSEGERTAITFMYFLKTLNDDKVDLKSTIVIIDDPVSSLDANSMYSAFGFMKERTKDALQLFILTHNFSFFRLVRNWFFNMKGQRSSNIEKQPSRFYMLETGVSGGKRTASICEMDRLLKDYESEYHYLFKKVYDESNRPASQSPMENSYGLPNIARRLLEAFLTFKLPNYESGKLEKKLDDIQFDPAKKSRVLRFLHVHSHFDQVAPPEHDLSVLNETPQILKDLMELMKAVDKEHFEGMESFLSPDSAKHAVET